MVHIGIIGDYNPASRYHRATEESLQHAAAALGYTLESTWLPTPSLDDASAAASLDGFDGLWCAPGSPYASMAGALAGIQFARERGKPFVGT